MAESQPYYEKANNPEALQKVLDDNREKFLSDMKAQYNIFYSIGDLNAVISVYTQPLTITYTDLSEKNPRPPTEKIKTVVGNFLWNNCPDKENHNREEYIADKFINTKGHITKQLLEWTKQRLRPTVPVITVPVITVPGIKFFNQAEPQKVSEQQNISSEKKEPTKPTNSTN